MELRNKVDFYGCDDRRVLCYEIGNVHWLSFFVGMIEKGIGFSNCFILESYQLNVDRKLDLLLLFEFDLE